MISKIFIFILFFIISFISEVWADTVYLKNGRSMQGIIKKENKEGVWLDIEIGTVKFRWEAIEDIDRSSPDEITRIRQEWQKQEEAEEELEGYEEKLLKENPEIKRILTRQTLSREILGRVVEEFRPHSLKKDLKLSLEKTIHWWIRHMFMITFLVVGLFALPSVTFNSRFGIATRIIATVIVIVLTYYLLMLLTDSLKSISIYYK